MMPEHYNLDDLLAFLERGERKKLIFRHLASCPECREQLRLLVELRRAGSPEAGHPDQDELLAFQTGALGRGEKARIAAHLKSCPACRDAVRILEYEESSSPAPGPRLSRDLLRLYREQFPAPTGRLVLRLTRRLIPEWIPDDISYGVAACLSASSPWDIALSDSELCYSIGEVSSRENWVTIPCPDFEVSVAVQSSGQEVRLVVVLRSPESGKPVEGVPLRFFAGENAEPLVTSDFQGQAEFVFRGRTGRLEIGEEPPFVIPIELEESF